MLGWKSKPLSEQEEDLECLCHLMKTCGRILDTPNGKYRMDQYFERMDQVLEAQKMPLRIRFMIQDIMDLRRNKWAPRRAGKDPERGPRTIQQVREDAARDGFIYMPQETSPPQKMSPAMDLMYSFEGVFNKRKNVDDFFGSGFSSGPGRTSSGSTASPTGYLAGGYLGTGPGAITATGYDDDDDGYKPSSTTNYKSGAGPQQAPMVLSRQPREPLMEQTPSPPAQRLNEPAEDATSNNNSDISLNMRRDSSHSGGGDAISQRASQDRESGHEAGGRHKRGGGSYRGGHHYDQRRDRHHDEGNKPAPPPDFGDRYSANRTRDQHRRQQHQQGDWNNDYQQEHRGGRGGYHNRGRFENYRNNNQHGGGPRFHKGPANDERFDASQPPPRFQQHGSDRTQNEDNLNNLPPRFNKKLSFNGPPPNYQPPSHPYSGGYQQQSQPMQPSLGASKDVELSLRPTSGNMLFKPKTPSLLPKSAIGRDGSSPLGENSLLGSVPAPQKVIMQQKEANIMIKQGSLDGKAKKEKNRQQAAAANKGPTREEVFAKVNDILDNLVRPVESDESPMDKALASWLDESWLPSKMTQTAVTQIYNKALQENSPQDRKQIREFLRQLISDKAAIDGSHCKEALIKILTSVDREAAKDEQYEAKVAPVLAEMAAWKVKEGFATLEEVADAVSPMMNSVKLRKILLQTMSLMAQDDKELVSRLFNESKINLKDHVEESEKNDSQLAEVLSNHNLSFLMPMLSIRQEMMSHLRANSDPESLMKWISGNVNAEYHGQPDFIVTLYSVVLGHIVESSTLAKETDATVQPEKNLVEAEKDLLAKFRTVLHSYVANKAGLQLTAVYALQVFTHGLGFPKGMLLRAFINCYELDVLDEHAFLQWKEDVNDFYPGKGQALFQV